MTCTTHLFPSGMRLIHLPSSLPVVFIGYQIAAGSRCENPGEEGLAHFCEHASFKGTANRRALQVTGGIERLGGELNAYTTKQDTTYYCTVLKEHARKAFDVLTDMVFHSVYPQRELDKEKEVVCDEIASYDDSPAELIFDEFENMLFDGHPLGHNILGTAGQVRAFTTDHLRRFADRYYLPANTVLFVNGDIAVEKIVKWVESASYPLCPTEATPVDAMPSNLPSTLAQTASPQHKVVEKNTHQAHVVIGSLSYPMFHPRHTPLLLLNNLLGGPSLNARLNASLRERRGLVYTVESTLATYLDAGLWMAYFGCDHDDVEKCCTLVYRELQQLRDKPLGSRQLAMAKRQLKGQIAVAMDNREQATLDNARRFLHYGKPLDIDRLFHDIDRLTPDVLQATAAEVFDPDKLSTLKFL